MKTPRVLAGVTLLILSTIGVFVYTVWMLGRVSLLPIDFAYIDRSIGASVVYLGLIIIDALSLYLLMRGEGLGNSLRNLPKFPGYNIPINQIKTPEEIETAPYTPPYKERVEANTLESLLGSAMNRGMSADLRFTLKLPDNTKLNILGQEWEVKDAEIKISKAPQEEPPKPLDKPTNGFTPEEQVYYNEVQQ